MIEKSDGRGERGGSEWLDRRQGQNPGTGEGAERWAGEGAEKEQEVTKYKYLYL